MKKILSIALCATAVSAFADPAEVELGTVGVTAITTPLSNTIVAVSYDDLAGGSGMVVSNFVKTTNLTVDDQLAIFNNGLYDTWTLKQDGGEGSAKYWAKNAKTFTVGPGGQLQEGTGTSAAGITNAVGTGIWLVRQNPIDANGSTNTFYIYGKPVSDPVSRISANTWTLVGNPLQAGVKIGTDVEKGDVIVDGAQTGDQIVTVGTGGTLLYFAYVAGQGWSGLPDIGPGIGFWIRTQADTKIEWPKEHEE